MLAYHNDKALKKSVLAEMAGHRKAEHLLQGYGYWKDGKGCAVGCLIKSGNHEEYETKFGIPRVLAQLEDLMFERLSKTEAKKWPERFLNAIKPGADLSLVWPKFAVFILTDKDHGVMQYAKTEQTKNSIQEISDLYQRTIHGEKIDVNTWLSAREMAYQARRAADAYAADAYAADAAAAAAYAAAYAADAAYAAYAAAYAAAAYAADAAAARSRRYTALADKLIEILGEAPVTRKQAA